MSRPNPTWLAGTRKRWMHLYRGAPAVRSWSRHQETVPAWTLCGVRRDADTETTEDSGQVDCPFCKILLREGAA